MYFWPSLLVHVYNNASAWHTHATSVRTSSAKENRGPEHDDVDVEIGHIEAEMLRHSSRT